MLAPHSLPLPRTVPLAIAACPGPPNSRRAAWPPSLGHRCLAIARAPVRTLVTLVTLAARRSPHPRRCTSPSPLRPVSCLCACIVSTRTVWLFRRRIPRRPPLASLHRPLRCVVPPMPCCAPYAVSRPIAATLAVSVAAALACALACCPCAALASCRWPGLAVSCPVGLCCALGSCIRSRPPSLHLPRHLCTALCCLNPYSTVSRRATPSHTVLRIATPSSAPPRAPPGTQWYPIVPRRPSTTISTPVLLSGVSCLARPHAAAARWFHTHVPPFGAQKPALPDHAHTPAPLHCSACNTPRLVLLASVLPQQGGFAYAQALLGAACPCCAPAAHIAVSRAAAGLHHPFMPHRRPLALHRCPLAPLARPQPNH
ncbi:hypothetical protein DENSPDRAFT_886488 [Dentipellis sp. KUC8613]|nr:hypothetical protein DENSPDRAFT_886488 [Dentipellis sp. KUC8613]